LGRSGVKDGNEDGGRSKKKKYTAISPENKKQENNGKGNGRNKLGLTNQEQGPVSERGNGPNRRTEKKRRKRDMLEAKREGAKKNAGCLQVGPRTDTSPGATIGQGFNQKKTQRDVGERMSGHPDRSQTCVCSLCP